MRQSLYELEKKKKQTLKKYNVALANLPESAQQVNDCWLELKQIEKEIDNHEFMQIMGSLYSC